MITASDVETAAAPDLRFAELSAACPPAPIRDDRSYRKAVAVLDRLFESDAEKTEGELAYFQALARLVASYEDAVGAPPAREPGRRPSLGVLSGS